MSATAPRLLTAAVLAAGAALVLPAPASAAPKPCAVGTWKLTEFRFSAKAPGIEATATGGEDTRLTIAKKSVAYDFAHTRQVITKGRDNDGEITLVSTYKKRVTFKSTFTGTKKGALSLQPRSATGSATVSNTYNGRHLNGHKLAAHYRQGNVDFLIPVRPSYTCTSKTLTLTAKTPGTLGIGTVKAHYKRV